MGSSAATAPSLAVLFLAFNLLLLTLANANSPPPTKTTPPPPTKTKTPPPPPPSKAAGAGGKCPMDALKLGVCANVLSILNLHLGNPPKEPCCSLLQGLADAEVATCLCLALKASVLGINLNLPINLSLLINYCGKEAPTGFQCY